MLGYSTRMTTSSLGILMKHFKWCTRLTVINLAESEGIKIVEHPFSVDDVKIVKKRFSLHQHLF
ncbi:MAG: hypothetical protein CM15mP62_32440 [Rhodospirillaceae bacterium]|nr:MAG: hypothetical protein CM15mP62_32440 [Rhodospirillaceae bacterium]